MDLCLDVNQNSFVLRLTPAVFSNSSKAAPVLLYTCVCPDSCIITGLVMLGLKIIITVCVTFGVNYFERWTLADVRYISDSQW